MNNLLVYAAYVSGLTAILRVLPGNGMDVDD